MALVTTPGEKSSYLHILGHNLSERCLTTLYKIDFKAEQPTLQNNTDA